MTQKAFKYRFYPTPEQESLLRRTMGCTRLVYNRALAYRTEAWSERQERVRKVKGSNNRHKARLKVARIQAKIANSRQDFLHKLTTQLVRENQTIAVEDLAVKNMQKNRKLAKHISDASWGELVRQLEYKCAWYGRQLVKIDRWFPSSKRCHSCGFVMDKLPLDIREWDCPDCGASHDRDINAAINILAAGHAVAACGVAVRPDRHESKRQARKTRQRKKQEPLRA